MPETASELERRDDIETHQCFPLVFHPAQSLGTYAQIPGKESLPLKPESGVFTHCFSKALGVWGHTTVRPV